MWPFTSKAPFRPATVFLDTVTFKYASERLIRPRLRPVTHRWGDQEVTVNVTQYVEVFPNAGLHGNTAKHVEILPFIAYLAKVGRVALQTHKEVEFESWGLPKMDDPRGRFYGAPIGETPDPFPYGRTISGWSPLGKVDWQFEFVRGIQHPRFEQLKRAVGAMPESRSYKNQLLDAFHVLCAESAKVDFFLTVDLALVRNVTRYKKAPVTIRVVTPKDLLMSLLKSRHARIRDVLRYVRYERRARRTPTDHPNEQLLSLGKTLQERGYFDKH